MSKCAGLVVPLLNLQMRSFCGACLYPEHNTTSSCAGVSAGHVSTSHRVIVAEPDDDPMALRMLLFFSCLDRLCC